MKGRWQQIRKVLCVLSVLVALLAISPLSHSAGGGGEAPVKEYVSVDPAFVTNFGGPGKMRYLRIELALRINDPQTTTPTVLKHLPLVRHTMLMLMSQQVEEDLMTMEGKEILRQATLEEVRKIYAEQAKELKDPIKDVLFSSFIIQ